jgi:hypothetical protein
MPTLTRQIAQSADDGGESPASGNVSLIAAALQTFIILRFQNITIPRQATILNAYLTIQIFGTDFDDPNHNIFFQAIDNAPVPAAVQFNISSRARTTSFVNWTATGVGAGSVDTPSLKAPIQEVINRPAWQSGNALAAIWVPLVAAPDFAFIAWDGGLSQAATLTIEYEEAITPPIASPLSFYLITEKLPTVFTGKLNATPTDPYMTLTGDQGQTGSFGAPIPGMTVFFDGDDQKAARLRSWTPGTTGTFTISVGENDDVTPYVVNNEDVSIKAQFRLWPIYPRITLSGETASIFIDYDVTYTDQTRLWKPVAVAGPPAVVEYNGATAQARFVGDRSFALSGSAVITGWLWTAPGSVEGTSTSQGTEASPVTFTWTSPGQKLVYLTVTDTNGKTATNYTWVFVVDPNNPGTVAYTDFDEFNDNFDYEQGGGACSFIVHGGATVADFPNDCLVILASRPTTPTQSTPTGYWPYRDNVHFVGYVVGDSVRQNPIEGDVTFQAATIDSLMKNLTVFPVSLTERATPLDWTQANALIADRAASYLWHYYSTLSLMACIQESGYQGLIWRQDFGPSDLYSQINGELMASLWGKVVVNHQGVVYHQIDYNLMLEEERAEVTTRKRLHKGLWVDDVTIEERMAYSQPVNTVKMSGVLFRGGSVVDACPSFSEAPGNAPKAYGKELNYDRLILTSQADLNTRCGLGLAKAVPKYAAFVMRFINDGSFTVAPQEVFPVNIEANDNNRGIAYTGNLIPRRISRRYDHQTGLIDYAVGFEPETTGPPGVTVDLPCGPPAQRRDDDDPPEDPDGGVATEETVNSLALANEGSSFYLGKAGGQWERRVSGLTTLQFADMIKDPWTVFKQGAGPENIILWGCGPNFLAKSSNSGKTWGDHTAYMDAPPNSWSDGAAPSFTGTLVKQILPDYFRQNTFYILLQSANSGNYRGWIYHTIDDGFNFTAYALTGTSQALPLRMSIDTQDGSVLWLTLWEGNGNISLRKYGVTGAGLTLSSSQALMTGTTSAQVLAKEYVAYPGAPFGNKNHLYIYGRLTNPVGLSGTLAIIKSINGASSFIDIISDWGEDHCGAMGAGEADINGWRSVVAIRQPGLD